jgi:ABC-type phosphate transport system substrate-binding protein
MHLVIRLAAILAASILLVSPSRGGGIRIAGSDLLGAGFAGEITAFARKQGVEVSIAMAGSRDGLEKVKTGQADLAFVALPPGETMPTQPLQARLWACHVAMVVVPSSQPVDRLSLAQLAGIFAVEGQADIRQWGDLGAGGEWRQRAIISHAMTTGVEGGLALELLRHDVLRATSLKSNVNLHKKYDGWLDALATDGGGDIALIPWIPPARNDLKVLALSVDANQPAFGPTPENVHSGDYPLRWPVYVVMAADAAGSLRPWLEFLWSDQGAVVAEKARLVPLPASARASENGKN